MLFTSHDLDASLAPYIASIFHYKDRQPDHTIERVVPNGHVYIIFELDGITRHTYDNESLKPNGNFQQCWISGLHKNYISISAHPNSEMFVIQFQPGGSYPFFYQNMYRLHGKILPAEQILGNGILDLHVSLREVEDTSQMFRLAENWLKERFQENKKPPQELLNILEALQRSAASDFAHIITSYPNTQKHLIDQFKKYIGLTPKIFQRVLRFNEILQQIQQQQKISWAQIAYQCGFSDQSHFIKEFKHFSGFNPQEFIKQDYHQQENFFPLD